MLEKFNIIFNGVTDEQKSKVEEKLELLEKFYEIAPPLAHHIDNALKIGFNNIEFICDDVVGDQYNGTKKFGASCTPIVKKITVTANQDIFGIFHSIIFELANAVNLDLKNIHLKQFDCEEEYADTIEKAEYKSLKNKDKVILETLKLLENNKLLKQIISLEDFNKMILSFEKDVNITFDEHTQMPGYIEHRNFYVEERANRITPDQRLKKLINLKDVNKIKSLLSKINEIKKDYLEYVFNNKLDDNSIEIIKAFLNHPTSKDLLKNNLFEMMLTMDEAKIDAFYTALSQTMEAEHSFNERKLSSIKSDKQALSK